MVTAQDPSALEWSYELVPSSSLPVLDLSRSLKSRYLPAFVLTRVDAFLARYNQPLYFCYVLSLALSISVPLLNARTSSYVALISALLGLPLGLGSLGTLRYDVVRLLVRTYDFWFFLCVNGTTNLMVAVLFNDLRMTRLLIDWSGFQNIVLIDAQLRGIRQLSTLAVVGTFAVFMLLTCVMLGRVDAMQDFSIMRYQNSFSRYNVSAKDVVGNGLVTMIILLTKIVYRKRKAFRRRRGKNTTIECAIFRCRVKLAPCRVQVSPDPVNTAITPPAASLRARRPTSIQQMRYETYGHSYDSRNTTLPTRITSKKQASSLLLFLLYSSGIGGILLAFTTAFTPTDFDTDLAKPGLHKFLENGSLGLILTLIFTTTFTGLYQRNLFFALMTSFDFVFYAVQLTSIHVSLCILYQWEIHRCFGVATAWAWIFWVLTLDALTPMMKTKLNFHIRFAIPVVSMFILWHATTLYKILGDSGPADRIIWEGRVWDHHLQIRVVPFYFSRLVTLTLWCCRLMNRLVRSSNDDTIILRGAVTYENYLVLGNRRKSRARTRLRKMDGHSNQIAPLDQSSAFATIIPDDPPPPRRRDH
ncbi:hypothetical protein Gpo141_00006213 [Globisporangium polare]